MKYCMMPFVRLNCGVFDMYPCCDSWLVNSGAGLSAPVSQKSTYWTSDIMDEFRSSIADDSYRYCKRSCPFLVDRDNPSNQLMKTEAQILSDYPLDISSAIIDFIKSTRCDRKFSAMPYEVGLSYDASCNLSCRSCRHKVMKFTPLFTDIQERRVRNYFDTSRVVYIAGDGDPFASDYYRTLLQNDIREKFPLATSIIIQTNAQLLNSDMWDSINAFNKSIVKQLTISIDACTSKTYEFVRCGGRFETLLQNLHFIRDLKKSGDIPYLVTSFTISTYNLHEVIDFIEFAAHEGFDKIEYWVVQNWKRGDSYDKMAAHIGDSQYSAEFNAVIEKIRELKNNSRGIEILCGY